MGDWSEEVEFPEDEQEPEALRRKWEQEQLDPPGPKVCQHCGQPIEGASFFCLFCGERVFDDSGLLGRLAKWTKDGRLIIIVVLIIVTVLALYSF